MPRENTVEKSRVHFSWQAQYLVKLECDFSWQVQHVVTFWEIAGARNICIFHDKIVSKIGPARSPKCEMTIFSSDYVRNVVESTFYWRKQFRDFPLKS